MFESDPEKSSRSNLHVFFGFLLGIVASLVCLFLAIFFGVNLQVHDWVLPMIDAIALILVGIFAVRRARESSLALGMVISLSLALLLDAACAARYLSR